jgi:MoxR-like ATPase
MPEKIPSQNHAQTQTFSQPDSQTSSQPQTQQVNPVEQARQRLLAMEKILNKLIIGHEDAVKALMLALVSKLHVAMIGPPGTAKTMLAMTTAKLLNARIYMYLMTRFTTVDELYGPINIVALKNGELQRKWSDLMRADIAFIDEIFNGSSPILNSLLSIMQERVVYDSMTGQSIPVKLWTLIGASNEIPLDEELQALYDRFALKVFMSYLNDDNKLIEAIDARWANNTPLQPVASMDDVRVLHDYAVTLLQRGKIKDVGEVLKLYTINALPFIKTLRSKGIVLSDRTVVYQLALLYAGVLALYGVTPENVAGAVYDIMPYVARTPQEATEIRKALDDALGEVAELNKKLEQAKSLLKVDKYEDALKLFKEVATFDASRLASKPWVKPRVEAIVRVAQDYVKRVQDHLERTRELKEGL